MFGETDDEMSIRFCVDEIASVAGEIDSTVAVDIQGLLSPCVDCNRVGEHAVKVINMISFIN